MVMRIKPRISEREREPPRTQSSPRHTQKISIPPPPSTCPRISVARASPPAAAHNSTPSPTRRPLLPSSSSSRPILHLISCFRNPYPRFGATAAASPVVVLSATAKTPGRGGGRGSDGLRRRHAVHEEEEEKGRARLRYCDPGQEPMGQVRLTRA
uniref:Uncharacterized protein n=1 Tax=Oryza brachyantha TaxID=4533 RepID=J3MDZ4_ORYBR